MHGNGRISELMIAPCARSISDSFDCEGVHTKLRGLGNFHGKALCRSLTVVPTSVWRAGIQHSPPVVVLADCRLQGEGLPTLVIDGGSDRSSHLAFAGGRHPISSLSPRSRGTAPEPREQGASGQVSRHKCPEGSMDVDSLPHAINNSAVADWKSPRFHAVPAVGSGFRKQAVVGC